MYGYENVTKYLLSCPSYKNVEVIILLLAVDWLNSILHGFNRQVKGCSIICTDLYQSHYGFISGFKFASRSLSLCLQVTEGREF